MKILCINSKPNLDFFTKRGLILDVAYDTCNKIFPTIKTQTATTSDNKIVTLYSPDVSQYLEDTYKNQKYDVIIFGWNPKDYGSEFNSTGGQTFRKKLSNGAYYITARQDGGNYEVHELMHAIGQILYLDLKKYDAADQMDVTFIEGKPNFYYLNDQPENPKSNFGVTWETYKKYLPELNRTPSITLKIGSTGPLVKELQVLLGIKADGQFGPVTKKILIAFQRSKGLVADGICGPKTWEVLKKKPSIDLSKWKLDKGFEILCIKFLEECETQGYKLKITHGLRTIEEQDKLYASGRTLPGKILTNAKGGQSKHNFGKAIDVAFQGNDPYPKNFDWKKIGLIGEKLGMKWGGKFPIKDFVHFEV